MRLFGRVVWPLQRLLLAGIVAVVIPVLTLSPYLYTGTELARLRNALIFDAGTVQSFQWGPDSFPKDFLLDEGPIDPYFAELARRLDLAALPSDWARARAISSHLLGSHPPLLGGAVQSNLVGTYEAIVGQGRGYCADYVLVFRALAAAAGIPVRAWAFSFDGFGGHGHVWPEIWDREAHRWYLIDVYNNNYFLLGSSGVPLSALEFRQAMFSDPDHVRLMRLDSRQPPGYVRDDKALAYYQHGLAEWYMWWGSNPFTYEGGLPYRWLLIVSRPAAQLTAIALGEQPRIHPLITDENQTQVRAMHLLRIHLELAAATFIAGLLCLLWASIRAIRRAVAPMLPSTIHG